VVEIVDGALNHGMVQQRIATAELGLVLAEGDDAAFGMLDCLAVGVPVITERTVLSAALITDGETGVLTSGLDSAGGAALLADLLGNDARRGELARAARGAAARWPLAAMADGYERAAATARDRYMVKRILKPRRGAEEMRAFTAAGEACGILFGPERTGLVNDHIALADTVLTVPLNPAFSSLNLAQAVLLVGYEWFTSGDDTPAEQLVTGHSKPATKEELMRFFGHFEEELDRSGFLRTEDKRPGMIRNLRNLFQRAQLTAQELRTLHGVITAFVGPRNRDVEKPQKRVRKRIAR